MADIAYVNKAYGFNATAVTTVDVPVPSGLAAGHRMVCVVGSIGASPVITDPPGSTWTKLAEFAPGTSLKTAVYYRDITAAAEPASYTWTFSAAGRNFGYVTAYSGCDLAVAPSAASVRFEDTTGPNLSPALALSDRDWLVTAAAGRESPGTETAKTFSNADTSDQTRFAFYSANTGTGAKLVAGLMDSGRALTAGSAQRSISNSPVLGQVHLWSIRLAAQVETTPAPTGTAWTHMGLPIK